MSAKKNTVHQHLKNAIVSIENAIKEVSQGRILTPDEAVLLVKVLDDQVCDLKTKMILRDLENIPGKDVAKKYGLTPGRISQIKKTAS